MPCVWYSAMRRACHGVRGGGVVREAAAREVCCSSTCACVWERMDARSFLHRPHNAHSRAAHAPRTHGEGTHDSVEALGRHLCAQSSCVGVRLRWSTVLSLHHASGFMVFETSFVQLSRTPHGSVCMYAGVRVRSSFPTRRHTRAPPPTPSWHTQGKGRKPARCPHHLARVLPHGS